MEDRDLILSRMSEGSLAQAPIVSSGYVPVEGDLWEAFFRNLSVLGAVRVSFGEFEDLKAKPCFVDPLAGHALGLEGSTKNVWEAEVGFSYAVCAIAQTGTLVVCAGPGGSRLSSLAPPINVVVVLASSIVKTLDEALGFVGDRTTVLITGPSRTADIEGILVRGVHGPGELLVYVKG